MVNLHKKNESGIPTGRHRVTRIENAPSALQDEGALVVPPAFAAGQQPHSRDIGSSGPLTTKKPVDGFYSSLHGQPAPTERRGGFHLCTCQLAQPLAF